MFAMLFFKKSVNIFSKWVKIDGWNTQKFIETGEFASINFTLPSSLIFTICPSFCCNFHSDFCCNRNCSGKIPRNLHCPADGNFLGGSFRVLPGSFLLWSILEKSYKACRCSFFHLRNSIDGYPAFDFYETYCC